MSAIVLFSSGLDSTVNLYQAHREFGVKLALTFDYGQRAAVREIQRSRLICERLGVPHEVVDLPWLAAINDSALGEAGAALPKGDDVDIDSLETSRVTAEAVWVPNRNGVFLNIAAAYAEVLGAKLVVPGFNKEEAATFADNSQAFVEEVSTCLQYSTMTGVRVFCFTTDMDKTEIVVRGKELGVPFEMIWSCYEAGEEMCGQCESCKRFERAMGGTR